MAAHEAHLPSRDRIVLSFVDKESRIHVQWDASTKIGEPINSHKLDRFAYAVSPWMRIVHVAKARFPWRTSHAEGWKRLGAEITSLDYIGCYALCKYVGLSWRG